MAASELAGETRRRARTATVTSLEQLVGAHPEALHDLYQSGAPTDPHGAGGRGRLLAIERLGATHAATRPLVTLIANHLVPARGVTFESGGTGGSDRLLGRELFRFHSEVADSSLDGAPALVLRYGDLGNPWPARRMTLELRTVAGGTSFGPALWQTSAGPTLVFWWGLEPAS